jgi:hypothetical protein
MVHALLLKRALLLFFLICVSAGQAKAQQVSTVVGLFHGLVERTAEPAPWGNSHLGARLELTVAANKSYTGKAISLGTPLTFAGTISETAPGTGTSTATILRGSQPALTVQLNFENDEVTGSISHPNGDSANLSGWRKVWDAKTRPVSSSFLGRFNFHVAAGSLSSSWFGAGTGFGSFTVPAGGDVSVSGKLPDGSEFKTTTFLGPRGQVLIYQPLYRTPGSFIGVLGVSLDPSVSRPAVQDFAEISWHKPNQHPAPERYATEGFKTVSGVSGMLYLPPVSGDVAGGLMDVSNNGSLMFSGAVTSSETPPDNTFSLTSSGVLTMSQPNPAKTTLSVKSATGEYSGSFTLTDTDTGQQTGTDPDGNPIYRKVSRTAKFQGLIIDDGKSSAAAGFYLLPGMPDASATPPVTLANSTLYGGEVAFSPNSGAPEPVVFGFDGDAANIVEGEIGWIRLVAPAVLEENRIFTVQVVPGTAGKADLSATQISVTIPAGQSLAKIRLPVLDDGEDEPEESFTLVLVDGPGYDINVGFCNVFISDDEEPVEVRSGLTPQLVPLGDVAEFTVSDVQGSDLQFEWQRDLVSIPGTGGNPLGLTNVQFSQAGSYRVKVFNTLNEEFTDAVDLAVVDTREKNVALSAGATATLTAGVSGIPGGLSYRWVFFDQAVDDDTGPNPRISGAQTPVLTIRGISEDDVGNYTCVVHQLSSREELSSGVFAVRIPTAPPELTAGNLPDGTILQPYLHQVLYNLESELAPGGFTAKGLPEGLKIDPDSGIISGEPTRAVQNAPITITCTNPVGTTTLQTKLTIHPFPVGALGTFHGLVARVTSDTLGQGGPEWSKADLGARLELQTTATGAFTGKLLNGSTVGFAGQLAFNGDKLSCSDVKVPVGGKDEPPCYLWLTIDPASQTFIGGLSLIPADVGADPEVSARVGGWRNAWSKTAPALRYAGVYNFTLTPANVANPQDAPSGVSFGSSVVPTSGTFNISGMLADGTTFTCNTFLGPDGQFLIYQPIYKAPGSLIGAFQIRQPAATATAGAATITLLPDDPTSTLPLFACSWSKPNQSDPQGKLYPRGYQPIILNVEGGLYLPPESGAVVMDLFDTQENALLEFITIDREFSPQILTISSTGKTTFPPGADGNPMQMSVTLNAATGQFSGAFTRRDEDPDRPPLYDDNTGRLIRAQGYFARSGRFFGVISPSVSSGLVGRGFFLLPALPDPTVSPPVTTANARTLSNSLSLYQSNAQPPLIVSLGDGTPVNLDEDPNSDLSVVGVTVRLSQSLPAQRTFALTVRHLTTASTDFVLSTRSVTFAPDATEAFLTLSSNDDLLDEADELFEIQLIDGPGYNVSPAKQRVVIVDDDEAPRVTTQPTSQLLSQGSPLNLQVRTEGSGTLSYQWRLDGVPILGAIQSELGLSNPRGGEYDVIVSNRIGTTTSSVANVIVVSVSERYIPVTFGGNATLPLKLSGPTETATFDWIKLPAGTVLTNSARISGSSTQTLTIKNISFNDEADYSCIVTKPAKSILVDGVETEVEPEVQLQGPLFHVVIINQAPELIQIPPLTAAPASGLVARPFSYQVTFDPDPLRRPSSFSASSLPTGLTIDPDTGLISGIPTVAVSNQSITITALNAIGADSVTTTITVDPLDSSALGTFHGYVERNLGIQLSEEVVDYQPPWEDADVGGLIEITTTGSGSFSGKLTYGSSTHNFSGTLANPADSPPIGQAWITRSGKKPLSLTFTIDTLSDALDGRLDLCDFDYLPTVVKAWKKVWSASQLANAYAGQYTFSIQPQESESSLVPGGVGFASCTVPANGAPFIVKGRLPDGTAFASSTILGPRGEFLVYQSLYKWPGSVLSALRLGTEPTATAGDPVFVVTEASTWYKPAQTTAGEIYRDGISPMGLSYGGGRAPVTTPGQIVLGLPDVDDNAYIVFSGAGANISDTNPETYFRIRPSGATVMKTGENNPARITVTVKPGTLEFSGGFTLKNSEPVLTRNATFQGVFIQQSDGSKLGSGFFTLKQLPDPPATTVTTAPSYTGQVEIYPTQ